MKEFKGQLNDEQRELLIDLYVEGLDAKDDEKVAKVLQFALRDEALDEMINRVNSFYAQELGFDELSKTVVELAREHLPSAFKENDFEEKTLTFGDVARQMTAKNRVPKGEEEINRQLAENATPLPDYLSLAEIKRIAAQWKLQFREKYWLPFFKEATFLTLRQSQQQAFAARAKRNLKTREKKNESGENTTNS